MIYQIVVLGAKGGDLTIDLCTYQEEMERLTVMNLKQKIAESLTEKAGGECLVRDMRLIFGNKTLEEKKRLLDYGIQHLSRIHMVIPLDGGLLL
uniref:Ubiquitin-like domain-containing protein n=1 Tax=Cyprinodon variegatus TaxID=28743 RepID=A0A3Q2EDZ3_CYPVA